MLKGKYPIRFDIMLIATIKHPVNHRGMISRIREALKILKFFIKFDTIPESGETISQEELTVLNDLQRNKIETEERHPKN